MSKKTNMFNVEELRKDFPILANPVDGKKLYYLDSAATSQKPVQVIEAITHYYQNLNANVHRGIHTLSEQATAAYESVRELVRALIDAPEHDRLD